MLLWILGLAFSFYIAYHFYRKSRVKVELKILYYNDSEISRLSDENRKISVRYGDQQVDRVTTTRVWLWNDGARPLKEDDIPQNDPLVIVISEKDKREKIQILDYKTVKTSRACANFRIGSTDERNRLKLLFDYIDSKEGAAFEIQHTGTVECMLKLDGVILGPKTEPTVIKSTQSYREVQNHYTKARSSHTKGVIAMIVFAIIWSIMFPIIEPFIDRLGTSALMLIFGGSILAVGIAVNILSSIMMSKPLYPKKLQLP